MPPRPWQLCRSKALLNHCFEEETAELMNLMKCFLPEDYDAQCFGNYSNDVWLTVRPLQELAVDVYVQISIKDC